MLKPQHMLIVAGVGVGVAALLALYIAKKGVAGAAAGAVGVAADAAAGTVVGIGEVFGIPATDETECEKAIREGRTWDASFACPAKTFAGSVWDRLTGNAPAPAPTTGDFARMDRRTVPADNYTGSW